MEGASKVLRAGKGRYAKVPPGSSEATAEFLAGHRKPVSVPAIHLGPDNAPSLYRRPRAGHRKRVACVVTAGSCNGSPEKARGGMADPYIR